MKSVVKTIVKGRDLIIKLFDCFSLLHAAKMPVTKIETTKMKVR